jgi:hypothetical protein
MCTPRLLLALLLLAGNSSAFGECECIWGGSFTDVQGETDLVVATTVIAGKGNSIDALIDQNMRGVEYRERIRIWLRTGDLCRPKPEQFPVNSRWVMALDRIDDLPPGGFNPSTPSISHGRVGDYSLSNCGGYWLSRHEDLVTGNLASGTRWEQNPRMSPVLLELVGSFVAGEIDAETLQEASTLNPELQRLQLETRLFLRRQR